jgi:hypothetical protein
MDQDNPVGSNFGSAGSGGGGSMSSGGNGGIGGSGGNDGPNAPSESSICPTCGQSTSRGFETFLAKIGITSEMIDGLKGQWQSVDLDEYMNTAREYLKDGSSKATSYAKENPGKVAAGVAALAVGVGLIYAAANRDKA